MASLFVLIVLVVVVVMTIMWAFGKALWWLRVTFPPQRRRGHTRHRPRDRDG